MSGVEWTFSPMIDVARDGRWGRVSEGYGEDPYANAVYGVAAVEGYQGDNLADSRRVAACLKHFVGYGASEPAATTSTPKSRVRRSGTPTCRPTRRASRPEPLR